MTGVLHAARISTVKVIVNSDELIQLENFALGKEMWKLSWSTWHQCGTKKKSESPTGIETMTSRTLGRRSLVYENSWRATRSFNWVYMEIPYKKHREIVEFPKKTIQLKVPKFSGGNLDRTEIDVDNTLQSCLLFQKFWKMLFHLLVNFFFITRNFWKLRLELTVYTVLIPNLPFSAAIII